MDNLHFAKIDDAMFAHKNEDYYTLAISVDNDFYYYMFARKKNKDTEFLVEKRTRDLVEFVNECSMLKSIFNSELVFEKGIQSHIIEFIQTGNISVSKTAYIDDLLENSINGR